MSEQARRVRVTLESRIESVDLGEELARGVAGAAGFDEDEQYKLSMAVREVLINALEHGNRGDSSKPIGLGFSLLDDRLVVEIQDQGKGFDIAGVPDPREDECLLKTSGRGLFLVRCFADELKVKSGNNGGATVLITKLYSNHSGSKPAKETQS